MPTKSELQKGFRIGEWEVLPGQGVMRRGDHEERPEPMVFEVLIVLASRDGELVSRQELIDEIWDGRPIGDEPVNRGLSQLRKHLGDRERPYRYIETLTRRGYRLSHKVFLNQPTVDHDQVDRVDGVDGRVRSVAVLPFDNLSGNDNDQYIVSGFKEELVHTLHSIPGFAVKHGRVAYPDTEVSDIAGILGVDAVLFGAVQREADILKINYNIASGLNGISLSSGSVSGQLDEIFGLQERLALAVRDDLLGESPQQLISRSRPVSFEAYDCYMRGIYALERRFTAQHLEESIALLKETILTDPQFGPAYLSLATAYAVWPDYRDELPEENHRLAVDTVEQGIAVDESIRDAASAVFGFVYQRQRKWAEAEQAYERATAAKVVDSNAFNWYSRMLASVGRLDDALCQILKAQKMDPSSAVINSRVAVVYTWLGNEEQAAEFYERSNRLGGGGENHLLGNALLLQRQGRLEESQQLSREGALISRGSSEWVGPVFAAITDPDKKAEALDAIESASMAKKIDPRIEVTVRTMFGDVDGAIRIANLLVQPNQRSEMDMLFLPELLPLRQHAEFPSLMQKLGIQSYWDEKGCVWLDDSISCPD